jgi:uncharacterized protein YndB with AHSA1/START domain
MSHRDFTTTFSVDQSPAEVFAAITNVRGWWSGNIEGKTAEVGDEFTYRYEDVHRSTQRVTEAVPGQRVVWRVLDATLSFAKDKSEWTGTEIRFDIARKGDQTEVRFTHVGLAPQVECFEACSSAWSFYIGGSLRELIVSGKGEPNPTEKSKKQGKRAA